MQFYVFQCDIKTNFPKSGHIYTLNRGDLYNAQMMIASYPTSEMTIVGGTTF